MLLARQVVAAVTALAVLLCGVACVCGSAPVTIGINPHATAAGTEPAGALPPCHRHRLTHASPPAGPVNHKLPGHSCPHCQSGMSPQVTSNSRATDVGRLPPMVGPFLRPIPPLGSGILIATVGLSMAHDLAPPSPRATLLRLHCALNT
jgi:hypothetical protein